MIKGCNTSNGYMGFAEGRFLLFCCESCHYTFRYPLIPLTCPDCGRKAVRPANRKEIKAYRIEQIILAEEIRSGLYGSDPV